MPTLPEVQIYSDGACSGNPGPGGWAALLLWNNQEKLLHGGERETTNNRMELTAPIEALKSLNKSCHVILFTDSTYLQKGATEWLPGWKKRGWKRKEGPLLNADLWQALEHEMSRHVVEWRWVKAHAGQMENERVDALARASIPERPN